MFSELERKPETKILHNLREVRQKSARLRKQHLSHAKAIDMILRKRRVESILGKNTCISCILRVLFLALIV